MRATLASAKLAYADDTARFLEAVPEGAATLEFALETWLRDPSNGHPYAVEWRLKRQSQAAANHRKRMLALRTRPTRNPRRLARAVARVIRAPRTARQARSTRRATITRTTRTTRRTGAARGPDDGPGEPPPSFLGEFHGWLAEAKKHQPRRGSR